VCKYIFAGEKIISSAACATLSRQFPELTSTTVTIESAAQASSLSSQKKDKK